jgi:broad specificity phosphatase PhoE
MRRVGLVSSAFVLLFAAGGAASAQEAVYIVRHAERADQTPDSALSTEGVGRALHLAEVLKGAGITRVFTSDARRTIDTAAPLAKAAHVTPQQVRAGDAQVLAATIADLGPRDRVLVVGHSNTVPDLLRALRVTTPITIGDDEYDNLFVVVPKKDASPVLLRLKY